MKEKQYRLPSKYQLTRHARLFYSQNMKYMSKNKNNREIKEQGNSMEGGH